MRERLRKIADLPVKGRVTHGFTGTEPADGGKLTFSIAPNELRLELNIAGGADPFELRRETLQVDLAREQRLAYTEVLSEILNGHMRLSVRGDSAEECWRIVQPVKDAWSNGDVPLEEYEAGSAGPADYVVRQAP